MLEDRLEFAGVLRRRQAARDRSGAARNHRPPELSPAASSRLAKQATAGRRRSRASLFDALHEERAIP